MFNKIKKFIKENYKTNLYCAYCHDLKSYKYFFESRSKLHRLNKRYNHCRCDRGIVPPPMAIERPDPIDYYI
jgi:hypothetical protein